MTSNVIAIRGERLALVRTRAEISAAFHAEVLCIAEIDADERIMAYVAFDSDDFDAAFAELDSRYLAGEAAPHAHTWSAIAGAFAAVNRHELPELTRDWVNIDHRRAIAFAPGGLNAYIHATLNDARVRVYIVAVHRLSDLGAVITHGLHGTSQEGFYAEWRLIALITFAGDRFNRWEGFDEADLDAALVRFDELHAQERRLENAATRVYDRLQAYYTARDWGAMTDILSDDHYSDDRRRVVNAGIRQGRDAAIANMQAAADVGTKRMTSTVVATRGERLALSRTRVSGRNQRPGAFNTEALDIIEVDAENRIAAYVAFDPDDIDAAIAELDTRYLAGEAAAHAQTWSVIARTYATLNRRELPATTPGWANIDHRRGTAHAPGDLFAYLRAAWDLTPDRRHCIEAVHQLSDIGAVFTAAAYGTTQEGLDAEWRLIALFTVAGDQFNRSELFDEVDLDAALTRFDELSRPARRLENAASQVDQRFWTCFAVRDWAALGEILADDISADDRRRVVNAGMRIGRDAKIADMRATAELGTKKGSSTVIAIRGQRLALVRIRLSGRGQRPDAFHTEMLGIVEINADNRMAARLLFDADALDAAFEELDARYLAGEGAAHARIWSVITQSYAAPNRHELPATTPGWVNIDHRRGIAFAPGDTIPYLHATWDVAPDFKLSVEAVHRLTDLGAISTWSAHGTSEEGFDAEWRGISIHTVEGDLINRLEVFDEADIDAALARFEELHPHARRLENAASQVTQRFWMYYAARDWDAMAENMAADYSADDRRRVVNDGTRHDRDAEIENARAAIDTGFTHVTSAVIATRGERLVLSRIRSSGRDQRPEAFRSDFLSVLEIDANERVAAHVMFDLDDIDAAFEELDSRYLVGEAAVHSHTWSVIARAHAGFNRHELPATTQDCVKVDHRLLVTIESSDLAAFIGSVWDLTPELSIHIEAVHRLTDLGAVVTHTAHGFTPEGFDADWRMIFLYTVEDDLISGYELFDEADLDAALARFDELDRPTPLQ